jgi:hypothetical protein
MCTHKHVQTQMAWRCWKPNDFTFEGGKKVNSIYHSKYKECLFFCLSDKRCPDVPLSFYWNF